MASQKVKVVMFLIKAGKQRKCFEVLMFLLERHFANIANLMLRKVCEKLAINFQDVKNEFDRTMESIEDPSLGQCRLSYLQPLLR